MQLLSTIETAPAAAFVLKLMAQTIHAPKPPCDIMKFPFHRTQLLDPTTSGAPSSSATGGNELENDAKVLFVTTMYDQSFTAMLSTSKAKS